MEKNTVLCSWYWFARIENIETPSGALLEIISESFN